MPSRVGMNRLYQTRRVPSFAGMPSAPLLCQSRSAALLGEGNAAVAADHAVAAAEADLARLLDHGVEAKTKPFTRSTAPWITAESPRADLNIEPPRQPAHPGARPVTQQPVGIAVPVDRQRLAGGAFFEASSRNRRDSSPATPPQLPITTCTPQSRTTSTVATGSAQ